MEEFQCSWCNKKFHWKDGHFCFLKGKPDNEYSESDLDELEKLAERLEAATRKQNCTRDDFRHSNPKTQAHDIQLNCSFGNDGNFCTKNIFRVLSKAFSKPPKIVLRTPYLNKLKHHKTTFAGQITNSQILPKTFLHRRILGGIIWDRYHRENLKIRFLEPIRVPAAKENKPSEFIRGREESHLQSISASPTRIERDGNNAEAQKGKKYSKIKSISAKVTKIGNSSTSEIATNSVALLSIVDAEAVSVAGPSGIHTQSHRTCKEKRFVSDVCGKDFSNKYNLKVHHRTHTGETHFVCHACGRRFTRQSNLTRHLRTHTGEKPFACPRCVKKFGQKQHLEDHLRTHTGEKPFACPICGKEFTLKGNLKMHIRTHSGEKPFACHICGMEFTLKGNLKMHIRTHSGEKPFACHICRKAFAQKSNLACHLRTHTGEEPYKCKLCSMDFANQSDRNEHYKRKHGGK
ncbi:Krueppel-related zinc finger protein 1 [Araneus ventricosus]|uniref:Krueppel-related zinc finger protein 1 n=1 Tax=Araneus ventricosus TaxID=182803 RepID=A0A4Y2JQ04_ARAVE|nr:Krueppel-related zinc finger protein 1 [Araneus ventricosus]